LNASKTALVAKWSPASHSERADLFIRNFSFVSVFGFKIERHRVRDTLRTPYMNLYLLRHAKAEPHGTQYPNDSKRPLSAEGEKNMRHAAQGMAALGLSFDLIISRNHGDNRQTGQGLDLQPPCAREQPSKAD
jgi:hypothetical protein